MSSRLRLKTQATSSPALGASPCVPLFLSRHTGVRAAAVRAAADIIRVCHVMQNSEKRFDAYKECALRLNYREREPLPHCVVATIRCIYPAADGVYVGYKPA